MEFDKSSLMNCLFNHYDFVALHDEEDYDDDGQWFKYYAPCLNAFNRVLSVAFKEMKPTEILPLPFFIIDPESRDVVTASSTLKPSTMLNCRILNLTDSVFSTQELSDLTLSKGSYKFGIEPSVTYLHKGHSEPENLYCRLDLEGLKFLKVAKFKGSFEGFVNYQRSGDRIFWMIFHALNRDLSETLQGLQLQEQFINLCDEKYATHKHRPNNSVKNYGVLS